MGFITRASLPEEFFDITSSMLLTQPEPQYLFAQLCKVACNAALNPDGALGISPARSMGERGAPYATPESDRLMMADPIYSEAIHVVPELGKAPGHTVRLNRPKFANSTYTEASRLVPSGTSISTTPIDLSSEQVPVTLKRFAGPYSGSAVAPYGVDRFDASLSLHKVASMVGLHLKRDFDRWLDNVMLTLFETVTSGNIVRPAGFAADTDSTVAGDAPMDFDTLARVESTLDTANVPVFANGRRAVVLHPRQLQQLKNDAQYVRYAEDHPPVNPVLAQNYYKTIGGLDIFKSTSLGTNASTVTIYKGVAFGPGKVGCGMGEMPRVAYSTNDNYGEQALVLWLWYFGAACLDDRFGCSIRTS